MQEDETLDRARAYIGAGQLQEALDLCLPLANAGHAEAIYLLAVVTHHAGLHEQAMNLYREAAKLLPGRADVLYNFGVFLRETGEIDGAIEAWMQASKHNHNHWQAAFNLGLALSETGRDGEAVRAYEQCLRAAPGNIDASYNLGNACFRLGRWERARSAYEGVLGASPFHSGALSNLGLTLMRCGEDTLAVEACRHALTRAPDDFVQHVNLGHTLLAAGEWVEGFRELEWRRKAQLPPVSLMGVAQWQGENLSGGHLVLYGEQGHGDVVQYVRFAQMARERANAGHVSVVCHAALKDVLRRAHGVDATFTLDEAVEKADACYPLMSLPVQLWTADSVVMPTPPYIARSKARVLPGDGLKVGLVWRGNPEHANDVNRSCPFTTLAPLFETPGVQFYALQWQGMTDVEREAVPEGVRLVDLGHDFDGFAQVAEILVALDVLITVDTAMAHLGGALGVETWVMLPQVSDWRWRGPEGFSPWYPEVKLFQQVSREEGWAGVVVRLAQDLGAKR